MIDLEPL
jgi:hypothetical protein